MSRTNQGSLWLTVAACPDNIEMFSLGHVENCPVGSHSQNKPLWGHGSPLLTGARSSLWFIFFCLVLPYQYSYDSFYSKYFLPSQFLSGIFPRYKGCPAVSCVAVLSSIATVSSAACSTCHQTSASKSDTEMVACEPPATIMSLLLYCWEIEKTSTLTIAILEKNWKVCSHWREHLQQEKLFSARETVKAKLSLKKVHGF